MTKAIEFVSRKIVRKTATSQTIGNSSTGILFHVSVWRNSKGPKTIPQQDQKTKRIFICNTESDPLFFCIFPIVFRINIQSLQYSK